MVTETLGIDERAVLAGIALVVIGGSLAAAVCWRLCTCRVREDAIDELAHGDSFPVIPSDSDLVDRLRSIDGTHCEAGAPFHSTELAQGAQRSHG